MALALPARTTRRLIMQKARSDPEGLLQLEGAWVQVLFHSPRGVLFTFPSRYWFAIGRWLVFSLGGWALRIQAGFHVSRPTWDTGGTRSASSKGLSPATARLSRRLLSQCFVRVPVPQPHGASPVVWAISAFARRYLRNRVFFLLLRLLRCFTSPGVASDGLWIQPWTPSWRMVGCPIRKSPDQRPHASPRSLSQLAASFFACHRQGIRHTPVQSGRLNHWAPGLHWHSRRTEWGGGGLIYVLTCILSYAG